MPASAIFRALLRRIRELEKHLVPPIDPTGTYDDAAYDRMRGFRLLIHAEIEDYIESRCLEIAVGAFNDWSTSRKHSIPISALVAYYTGALPTPPTRAGPRPLGGGITDDLDGRVRVCFESYNAIVRSRNHGIKEENLLAMLLPIGFRASELDATWLATINSFSSTRGLIAHSGKQRLQQPIDPKTEVATVGQILRGLRSLDQKLEKLK